MSVKKFLFHDRDQDVQVVEAATEFDAILEMLNNLGWSFAGEEKEYEEDD